MDELGLTDIPADYRPRFNAAPSQFILAARDGGKGRKGAMLRWGLVPSWAGDPKIGNKMINARSETVSERPSFRNAFEKRRCIIPADGFYEWRKEDGKSFPVRFRLADDRVFAFAGLWEYWKPPGGSETEAALDTETLFTCTILTTEANELVRPVHARMPVMLSGEAIDKWLDQDLPGDAVRHLLRPYPADTMESYDVSRHVNSPANDNEACILPI